MKAASVAVLCAALLAAGCASTDTANSDPPEEREYATGSNIPKRSRDMAKDVKVYTPAASDAAARPATPPPRGP